MEISDSLSNKAFIIATYRGMFRLYMIDIVSATLTIYDKVLARGCLAMANNDTSFLLQSFVLHIHVPVNEAIAAVNVRNKYIYCDGLISMFYR